MRTAAVHRRPWVAFSRGDTRAAGTLISGLFPRGARLLLANGFFATVPLGFQMVVMPLYLSRVGFDPAFIGLLFTISGLVSSALVAASGLLADRFGRSKFLIAGSAVPIFSYVIFATTTDPVWLALAAGLGGVGLANGAAGALAASSFDALLAERTTEATRTRVFTSAQAVWNLALAMGAALAIVPEVLRGLGVGELESYRPMFVASALWLVGATALVLPLRDLHREEADRASHWLPRRSLRPIAIYSIGIGFLGFGLGVAIQLMPLWFNLRFGATEADLAPWYTASQLTAITSVLIVPRLDRALGPSRSVLTLQVTSALLMASILVAPVFAVAAALFVARSLLMNISWPFQQSLLMSTVVPSERASAAGIGFSVWGFTNSLGPAVAGTLLATGVLALPILLGALAYAGAGLVLGIGFGRIRRGRIVADVPAPAEVAS